MKIGWGSCRSVGFDLIRIGGFTPVPVRAFYECFIVMTVIAGSLVPSLLHNVALRHIAVILPIILLIEGIGSHTWQRKFQNSLAKVHATEIAICVVMVVTMVGITSPQLWLSIDMLDHRNKEYSLSILERPIRIIKEFAQIIQRLM